LKKLEDIVWSSATSQIMAAEKLQKFSEAERRKLTSLLEAEKKRCSELEEASDLEYHRAHFWKKFALSAMGALCLLGGIFIFCWTRG
jgi:hypothetical protein